MFKKILTYGAIAGLVAIIPMSISIVASGHHQPQSYAMAIGYLIMLVALSAIFIAIKRHRDVELGGVIRFWPAFGMGLGISVVAGIIYVAGWEATQAITHMHFADDYARAMIAQQQARGVSGEALAKVSAEMEQFKAQYANPLYRWPMTFAEIFPVGVLVALISAVLLRNSRFLPARQK